MKNLQEFRTIVEEESDYSKFDMLVRAGLANKAQLQRIHKILDKMKEDRPVFNNADRMILQNLFNKMVDLISNNKQIFQQTRRAVREETEELEEGVLDSADYKVSSTGRKYRAHRIVLTKDASEVDDKENIKEAKDSPKDPPFVVVLKRKAVRLYPDNTKVAMYYSKTLDKYFTVPFGKGIDANLQAEEVEELQESVMDQLHKIVDNKQSNTVRFANGQSRKVDHFTASAITQVHKALNDDNKKKFADMVHKSPAHLAKASDFAFKHAKS
jgi:hypothetical protein